MKVATLRAALASVPDHAEVWVRRLGEANGLYADHVEYRILYGCNQEDNEDSLMVSTQWVLEIVSE